MHYIYTSFGFAFSTIVYSIFRLDEYHKLGNEPFSTEYFHTLSLEKAAMDL